MTREEAIETIRRCCPKISDSECDFETAMRFLIPELRESEDERIRKELVESFEALGIDSSWNRIPVKSVIAWLEKQKPAGWSEEDEKHINNILDIIDYWKATTHFVSYQGGTIDADINWLKFLKPQYHGDVTMTEAYKMGLEAGRASSWKPSEEQIQALEKAIVRAHSADDIPILTELRDKLKKL